MDLFPLTSGADDIQNDVSSHVECVCLLDNKNAKMRDCIEIGVDAEEYYRIKEFREERQNGFK